VIGKIAVGAIATLVAGAAGLVGLVASAAPSTLECMGVSPGRVVDLDDDQADNARLIVAVGQQRGVPERGLLVALMTAMQESTLKNLDYGDRDSLGLFQQRPSTGWGTPGQVTDPAYAAAAFYGGPASPTPNPGLLDIGGWEQMALTEAAQAVQRSAFPDAYAKWESSARGWLADILGGEVSDGTVCFQRPSTTATVVISSAAQWLGTPYSWGGGGLEGPTYGIEHGAGTVGFDCSGLTRYAYAQAGIVLPRVAADQYNAPGDRVTSFAQLQPGDLVFFAWDVGDPSSIHHVAIWLGGDSMLEAPRTGDVVKITPGVSSSSYWSPQFIGGLQPE
jgi:cell wall-associated NlpC family hydrolase